MLKWTQEQVLALAPDEAAIAPARQLSSPAKWVTSGVSDTAAWGEAQGSGAKPYQTAIDLRQPAFKCSCPSRKIPCKHCLGLMLRLANGELAPSEPPNWVAEWLQGREDRATKKEERKAEAEAPDPEAAAARAEKRWRKMMAGVEECKLFLADIAAEGLIAHQSTRSWDQMAARMVDAQAPGIARKLRMIGSQIGIGPNWATNVTADIGNLSLLLEAAGSADRLGPPLDEDIRATLGIPVRKEDLGPQGVADEWDVMGRAIDQEDRLTVFRTWLFGRTTRRFAMHLAYAAGSQSPDVAFIPGMGIKAQPIFYPSAWPLRAHLESHAAIPFDPGVGGTWREAGERLCDALAQQPWIEQMAVHLTQAAIGRQDGVWYLIDAEGAAVPVRRGDIWGILALTGNGHSELFGEWNGIDVRLLAAWNDQGFTTA